MYITKTLITIFALSFVTCCATSSVTGFRDLEKFLAKRTISKDPVENMKILEKS